MVKHPVASYGWPPYLNNSLMHRAHLVLRQGGDNSHMHAVLLDKRKLAEALDVIVDIALRMLLRRFTLGLGLQTHIPACKHVRTVCISYRQCLLGQGAQPRAKG